MELEKKSIGTSIKEILRRKDLYNNIIFLFSAVVNWIVSIFGRSKK
ncbi:hypothetical protein HYW87_02925 [Candidatus Roizmanbacteria bacterium]|nr:hypothetical protein [Candidatus Roizmanbacteria bacterium]